ncbi:hypothetical protein RN001_006579 [Aquatica leii]|uniref:Major facilitator superfamily (MFS) profile domain-containing protein n=1 Tax=Aquatica leii TaxID=1421715 RepID=A0AAN7SSA0_9COLE|nr:hypothetical protein RN001_006579 [Aquatica leii]
MSKSFKHLITNTKNYHTDYLTFCQTVQKERLSVSLPPIYDSNSNLLQKRSEGRKAPQIIAALIASLTAFSAGSTIAWTAQISEKLLEGKDFPFAVTVDQLGWIGSLMPLGASVLSLFTGTVCDRIGRKATGLILVIPSVIGWSLIIWTQSVTMLYVGRFITGMAAGGFCVFTSLYNHEIGQKEIRGALGSFLQMMISCGILFSAIAGKFLTIKMYSILCGVVPLIFGVLFLFMPETPFYYIKKKKLVKARTVLLRLRGSQYNIDKEITDINNYITENTNRGDIEIAVQCLKKRSSIIACVVGFGLMIFKVVNGVDAITTYTSYILTNANIGINSQTVIMDFGDLQENAIIQQKLGNFHNSLQNIEKLLDITLDSEKYEQLTTKDKN